VSDDAKTIQHQANDLIFVTIERRENGQTIMKSSDDFLGKVTIIDMMINHHYQKKHIVYRVIYMQYYILRVY